LKACGGGCHVAWQVGIVWIAGAVKIFTKRRFFFCHFANWISTNSLCLALLFPPRPKGGQGQLGRQSAGNAAFETPHSKILLILIPNVPSDVNNPPVRFQSGDVGVASHRPTRRRPERLASDSRPVNRVKGRCFALLGYGTHPAGCHQRPLFGPRSPCDSSQ